MPGDVQNVIDPSHDPKVTILVSSSPIAGKITALDLAPVLFLVPLFIAPDGAQHRWPRLADNEFASNIRRHFFPLVIYYCGVNPKKRQSRCPRFERSGSRQRSYHDRSGFGLPPGIDDRAATAPDDGVIPHPGLRVNWFSHRAEQSERREI